MKTLPQLAGLKRADRRRLLHLCSTQNITRDWLKQIESGEVRSLSFRNWPNPEWLASVKWMFAMRDKLGISDEEAQQMVRQENSLKWRGAANYRAKPVREKRDNKDVPASSRGCSGNTIRFPRKVRSKACWRRFYKLFPHLQPA